MRKATPKQDFTPSKKCYAVSVMSTFGPLISLSCVGLILFVIWQIVTALNRISKSVEDIALTLRRMEIRESPLTPDH